GRAIISNAKASPASLLIDMCGALLEEEGIRTNRQPPIHPANTHGYHTRLGAELVSRASQHSPALRASMQIGIVRYRRAGSGQLGIHGKAQGHVVTLHQ